MPHRAAEVIAIALAQINHEKNFGKPLTNGGGAPSIKNCSVRQMLDRVKAVGTPSRVYPSMVPPASLPQNGDPENIGAFSSLTTELSKPRQSKVLVSIAERRPILLGEGWGGDLLLSSLVQASAAAAGETQKD